MVTSTNLKHLNSLMADTDDNSPLIGYARVSTSEQSVQMQIDALVKYGVDPNDIYSESVSGTSKKRPALDNALRAVNTGGTLVVWKLDRIARSMRNLLDILESLEASGVRFRSLTEGIETETPAGRLILHVLASLAQFERDLIRQRTRAGVQAAIERGSRFGAPHKIEAEQMPEVWSMVREKGMTHAQVGKHFGVTTHTIARRLKEYETAPSVETEKQGAAKKRPAKNAATKKRAKKKAAKK